MHGDGPLVGPQRVAQFVQGVDRRFVFVQKLDAARRDLDPFDGGLALGLGARYCK
jgi:hypothetical protein